jgi:sarcosine oxidase subunit alpha
MNADGPVDAKHDQGYVTSAAFSPHVGSMIGLGFLKDGGSRKGEKMRLVSPLTNSEVEVEIVSAHFVDPEGERLRA